MTWWGWTLSGTAVWFLIALIAGRFIAAVIAFGGHPPDWPPEWEPDDDPGDDGVYADARDPAYWDQLERDIRGQP